MDKLQTGGPVWGLRTINTSSIHVVLRSGVIRPPAVSTRCYRVVHSRWARLVSAVSFFPPRPPFFFFFLCLCFQCACCSWPCLQMSTRDRAIIQQSGGGGGGGGGGGRPRTLLHPPSLFIHTAYTLLLTLPPCYVWAFRALVMFWTSLSREEGEFTRLRWTQRGGEWNMLLEIWKYRDLSRSSIPSGGWTGSVCLLSNVN